MTRSHMTRAFDAPGPGTWEQDSTHCPRPLTAYTFGALEYAFQKALKASTSRYGLLLSHLQPARVNGFFYTQTVMVDPSDREEVGRRFQAAQTALESRIWLQDLARWDNDVKPDSIRRNRQLESVHPGGLDTEALIGHLDAVHENSREMVLRHHMFTMSAVIPMGLYLANAAEWTGLHTGLLLAPLKGASPVSLGAHEQLAELGAALTEAGVGPSDYSGLQASAVLEAIRKRPDRVGDGVRAYLDAIGLRLAGGYDIADPCAIELPELLVSTIWSSVDPAPSSTGEDALARVRDAVPAEHRDRFDDLFQDVRRMSRIRDERGILNDSWGVGIARHAILEAGRRLAIAGRIHETENAVDAAHEELVTMLRGSGGPSADELLERTEWRRNASLETMPPFLGPPPTPPPPLDGLPPHTAEMMRAVMVAMAELFMPAPETPGATIAGKPVSAGVYTGTARVIGHPSEFARLSKGDVLVTASTSPAFNVVLPLLGAIVTDRGGQLSHAAIVAREYGIPAVVGTLKATSVIRDGARVRVDGGDGRVDVL